MIELLENTHPELAEIMQKISSGENPYGIINIRNGKIVTTHRNSPAN